MEEILAALRREFRKLRVALRRAVRVEPLVRETVRERVEYHGNRAGGWCILENSLDKDAIVVDVGLGEDTSFSESIIEKYGCVVNGFDPTPRAIEYVSRLGNDRLKIFELGIGAADGPAEFFLPHNDAHVSGSLAREPHVGREAIQVQVVTIAGIFDLLKCDRIHLLKLDTEGAEYEVFASPEFRRHAKAIDQICVEFHHRWRSRGRECTDAAVAVLDELGFACYWRSRSTNEEFSFVNLARGDSIRPSRPSVASE